MRKLLLLVASFAFLGGIFFGVPDTAAETFPEPKVTCTGNEKTTGQCVPGPEERYQFGAGDYCRQDGDQSARDALSHIQYQKLYGELDGIQRSKVDTLLLSATEARSLVGLVPCGRSCDDPTTEINEAAECSFCHFFFLLTNIMDWILKFAVTSIAALMIIFGGFVLLTSRGNPGQSQKGKDILIWTFAGLAVIFVGWMVVNSLLTGIGVSKWTGFTGETGKVSSISGDVITVQGNPGWADDDWNGLAFTITDTDTSTPGLKGVSRTITDTLNGNQVITDPVWDPAGVIVPGSGDKFRIGGWWQFRCGI